MLNITLSMIFTSLFIIAGMNTAVADTITSTPLSITTENDARAQYNLGMAYLQGNQHVTQNSKKALKLITKSAQNGYAEAQAQLGEMYITHLGLSYKGFQTKSHYKIAYKWLSKAAEQGNPRAYYLLGLLYYNGNGVQKDPNKTFDYYQKAANQGYAAAQEGLASMYVWGIKPATRDYQKARELYKKATDQNDQNAQMSLADMYRLGLGGNVDFDKAKLLYKEACDTGHLIGCYNYKNIENK